MMNQGKPNLWRLLLTPEAPGAWNMAVDEAILEAATHREVLPTLRLYAWNPPCLSLGYAQPISDVDESRLEEFGWDLVRRPTGGRAILHTDELTYSVCGPEDEPVLSGDILSSYKRLSSAILAAIEQIGISVQALPQEKNANSKSPEPVCFEVPSNYEITADGKKLVGSAQARRQGGVLQHGTLPLYGDLTRIVQVLSFPSQTSREQAAERLLSRAATLHTALGEIVSWKQAADSFIQAFQNTLDLELAPGQLTEDERTRAEQLVDKKYGNPAWVKRL
jgi:lipoate-protein ligase A